MMGDEEIEDIEPLLKYSRLTGDIRALLKYDPATSLAVHEKFLVLGTENGTLHILDHEGNHVSDKKVKPHEMAVNQISIDKRGEYIASCSQDGKTAITGLYSLEHNLEVLADRPVKAVAIDPSFSAPGGLKRFVTGHSKLMLTEKTTGIFGRMKVAELHKGGEGQIKNIKWNASYVAWANDEGVKIYDMLSAQRITYINFDGDFKSKSRTRADLYKCSLCWKDDTTLLIGWGNRVKVCKVKSRTAKDIRNLPEKYVEISAMFEASDYYISGIAPYGDEDIVLLTYSEAEVEFQDKKVLNPRPHVRLVEPKMGDVFEKANDVIGIRDYEHVRCDLQGLEWLPGECTYFIVSPREVIMAKPRTAEDHVNWLVDHKQFEEALSVVQNSGGQLKHISCEVIGLQFLDFLCNEDRFEEAAQRSVKILEGNKEGWENQLIKFQQLGKGKVLAKYLPQTDPRLSPGMYELVLYEFLQSDVQNFQTLLHVWDHSIYNTRTMINAVIERIKSEQTPDSSDTNRLYECLALLYSNQGEYSDALSVYLRLRHPDVFPFIQKHNLYSSIDTKIEQLMDFDSKKTLQLLMDNCQRIQPQRVMQQLIKCPNYQFQYLDRLSRTHPDLCRDYHSEMVVLYAKNEPSKLLAFLKRADGYDQSIAMKICEERELIPEKVYLLGKMGQHKKALELIILQLKDVKYAIDFCKEHDDAPLWNQLITYSLDKPSFVKGLLDNIGTHVAPTQLIPQIKENMQIPGLRDSLVKILQDYNLQMSLREGCTRILTLDVFNLLSQQVKLQRKGLCVLESQTCGSCHTSVLPKGLSATDGRVSRSGLCVFYCTHVFHTECLPTIHPNNCSICHAQKRGPGFTT